jgi:hypothetical protein
MNDDTYEYDIVNYQQADKGVREFLKYIANFIFYRFGLEVRKIFIYMNKPFFFRLDLLYNSSYCDWCSS